MADKRKAPNAPDAARKRKAPTIDLTATDVTPTQATPEPAPSPETVAAAPAEAAPEAAPPPPPEMPPPDEPPQAAAEPEPAPSAAPAAARAQVPVAAMLAAGIAGGVIVAAAIGALWYAGVLPSQQTPVQADTQAQQQIGQLQQQMQALQNRPAPAASIDQKTVDALSQRVAQLETTLKNLPKAGGVDPQLAQQVAALRSAITPLTQRLASTESAIKSGDTAVSTLSKRIDDIAANARQARTEADGADKAVTQLQTKMQDLARNQAGTVSPAQIESVQQKLATLEQAVKSARTTIAQSNAATAATRLALAAQGLRNTVVSGAPYAAELAQVKALGADSGTLAPLETFAANGIPSAATLSQQLRDLLPQMQTIAAPRAQATGSFLERLQANAGKLVHISPVNAPSGDEPADILARLEVEAAHDNVDAAAADIRKLPQAAQAPARDWLARVKARQAALAAADDLAAATSRALAPGAQ